MVEDFAGVAELAEGGVEAEELCGEEEVVGEAMDEEGGVEDFEGGEICAEAGEVECWR